MGRKKIETIIKERIHPYILLEKDKAVISRLEREYPYKLLLECIDIGVSEYFHYNGQGELTANSVDNFLDKLGGIAYIKSLPPIEQEMYRLKSKIKLKFSYYDAREAEALLKEYVKELKLYGWSETMIINDLRNDSIVLLNDSIGWVDWTDRIKGWINDVKSWRKNDTVTIKQSGTILPKSLFDNVPTNIQILCKQINASYENNLYDCAAVIMRKLLEGLLVLTYQNAGIESEIMSNNGNHHVSLDKIIKNAEQNKKIMLSANTKKDMALFKDLGNYSAHKIWYNCTQQDIEPHILKFRAIIEELMYKSGVKV